MLVTIDRFEGDFAVLELSDRTYIKVPRALMAGCMEGDIIRIEKDAEKTEEAKKKAEEALQSLFE